MASLHLLALFICLLASTSLAQDSGTSKMPSVKEVFQGVGSAIGKEIADVKQPVEVVAVSAVSSQCSTVKKIVGVSYEQLDGEKEPDVNTLTLKYITPSYNVSYNINEAAQAIPESKDFQPHQKLYIFIHGFTDSAGGNTFGTINKALSSQGQSNVLGLDGSQLIKWLYLRSSTYVRFMGEKLADVVASMVNGGIEPDQIHIIGHSLGAHVAGFTGKHFQNLTGYTVGRISGLDPAGPCFSHVDDDLRLKSSDATFVDVVHTDGGVFGLKESIGHLDFYPNEGVIQPGCFLQTCSHSRAWEYYGESIENPEAFPAVHCEDWQAFKEGNCSRKISYMGFPATPEAQGNFFLQTNKESPYARGLKGITFENNEGLVKKFTNLFG